METQESICQWANETFGRPDTVLSIAERAEEEMRELLHVLDADENDPKAAEEAADVVIVLMRVFERCGTTLVNELFELRRPHPPFEQAAKAMQRLLSILDADDSDPRAAGAAALVVASLMGIFNRHGSCSSAVTQKMAKNRARKWQLTGDGHGQHVREAP